VGAWGPELIARGTGWLGLVVELHRATGSCPCFDCGVDRYAWLQAGTGHGLRQASFVLRQFFMASRLPKKRPATYADLLALPDNVVGQIVDGELVVSQRPAPPHAVATTFLSGQLSEPYGRGKGGPGGWLIIFEPEVHLGDHILVPDLAGWLRERMPRLPETAWFELRPDWVCEVLSPSTAILDRTRKQDICRQNGVPWLWFVDPPSRTIEVFRACLKRGRGVVSW
jgi:Uma2 family endonuclease